MRISGHDIGGGADASSRTLVSGRARSQSRTHFGSEPTSSPYSARNQWAPLASTGVNPPSVLAGVMMLSRLYLWWADLMALRLASRFIRRQSR
jgi:hypothetical protein